MQSACMMAIDENDVIAVVDRLLAPIPSTGHADSPRPLSHQGILSTSQP